MGDENKGADAMIRERFEAMANPPGEGAALSGGRRVNVVWAGDGSYRGEGRDPDHQPYGDWYAWVALAEDILGVQRFEVAALLDRREKLKADRDALREEVAALREREQMACMSPATDCECAGCTYAALANAESEAAR